MPSGVGRYVFLDPSFFAQFRQTFVHGADEVLPGGVSLVKIKHSLAGRVSVGLESRHDLLRHQRSDEGFFSFSFRFFPDITDPLPIKLPAAIEVSPVHTQQNKRQGEYIPSHIDPREPVGRKEYNLSNSLYPYDFLFRFVIRTELEPSERIPANQCIVVYFIGTGIEE